MKENKYLGQRGITLIALAVTIIVLIILAGVTINVALGENGLFKKAEQTKEYMENAMAADETAINEIIAEMDGIIGSGEPEEIGEITREDMFEKTTEIKDDEGNSVWIPKDFGIDEDSATNQDEGIVITDEIGNEFVWVPVPDPSTMFETVEEPVTLSDGVTKTNKYSKLRVSEVNKEDYTASIPGDDSGDKVREPDVLTDEDYADGKYYGELGYGDITDMAEDLVREYNEMARSIETYHGFYIGRYELSGTKESPTVKAGAVLTASSSSANRWYGLKKACQEVIKNNTEVKSTMIYGCQWDETMSWLKRTKFVGEEEKVDEDSSSWGNYQDSISPANVSGYGSEQNTGYSENWSANKIYDLAGNYLEWTQEAELTNYRVSRGGYCYDSGSDYPGSDRSINTPSLANSGYAARATLIISDTVS